MYRVYVVDDDALILEEIVESVPWMDNGFEVVGYSTSPHEALEQIPRLHADVIFSDLKMPAMDGIEMIRILREHGFECEFVMLSAFGTFEDSRAFFLLEGFDYILKPLQQAEVQIVLERLARKLTDKPGKAVLPELTGVNSAFTELVIYITENFNQKHTLKQLSTQFNLSENYICNLFSKHYNSTLTRFITELRMREALRIMQQTDKAFKAIAVECGYLDYYYFCKVFKEYYGSSPTQYRFDHS